MKKEKPDIAYEYVKEYLRTHEEELKPLLKKEMLKNQTQVVHLLEKFFKEVTDKERKRCASLVRYFSRFATAVPEEIAKEIEAGEESPFV